MANSTSHAALPYPIRNARFSLPMSFRVAAGTPTDPTAPDTEYSIDGGATFADTAEEITTGGTNGLGYLTLTGAETNNSLVMIAAKSANDLTTPAILVPRVLALVGSGTLSAGSAGGGTLGTLLAYDVTGCFIRTTGGTGGGGTGGADNQARKIATYNTGTGAFTVVPDWAVTPDATTAYDVLLPEGVTLGMLRTLNPTTPGRTVVVDVNGIASANVKQVSDDATAADTLELFAEALDQATGQIDNGTFAAGAVDDAAVAADVTIASVTGAVGSVAGAVGSVTGNIGGNLNGNVAGNVSGSVGSVTGSVGSVTGAVGSVTGNVGGNVAGSTASVTGAVGSVVGNVGGDVAGKVLGGGSGTISGDGVRASSVTGAVGSVTGAVGSVTGAVGSVTAGVTVATNNDKTGYSLTQAFPTNFADLAITVTTGQVTVGTNADKTGYSISGTTTTLDALQAALNAAHSAGSWATATGFSTHSAADVWSSVTRTLTAGTNIVLAKGTGVTGFNDIAATDIVSGGAITTSGGAVSTVTTVTTATSVATVNGLAAGVITEASITIPAEASGRPTGILGMIRRIFEWDHNERTRDRSTGTVLLKNEAGTATLETQTQSTTGTTDTQTKGT